MLSSVACSQIKEQLKSQGNEWGKVNMISFGIIKISSNKEGMKFEPKKVRIEPSPSRLAQRG